MRYLLLYLVCLSYTIQLYSQSIPPKREFRAAWVATVLNIDYPAKGHWDSKRQQEEWIRLLGEYEALGFNAVIFQIRPAADAFYPSSLEPWSEYLTGQQGKRPEPYYDPLEFMIKACHERGIEFHAWLNPYRATMDLNLDKLSRQHPLKTHPERFFKYGNRYYFDPAQQVVRDHITSVIEEVVEKYDVDGIHFDDYFYPYKIKDVPLPDQNAFVKSRGKFIHIEDWRRNNVDLLIEQVSKKIKSIKPYVQFGISPFGVWRNKSVDPVRGSDTRAGITCYDDLYADVIKWLSSGWIDYVAPQIYWHIGFPLADYEILAKWWNENTFGRNLYIGHAAYKVNTDKQEAWKRPNELADQVAMNRSLDNIKGSIYFSTKSLRNNELDLLAYLTETFNAPALIPTAPLEEITTQKGPKLKRVKKKDQGLRLKWKVKGKTPHYYVIYRFYGNQIGDINNPKSIWKITPFYPSKKMTIYDDAYQKGQPYTYVVTAVSRGHIEGVGNSRTILVK